MSTQEQQPELEKINRLGERIGERLAGYFARITADDIRPQRWVREHTADVLARSRRATQVMTVEGRGGRPPEGYAIMPLGRYAELLELAAGQGFVPLHKRIAERTGASLAGTEPMPDLRGATGLRARDRARRPMRRDVPAPELPERAGAASLGHDVMAGGDIPRPHDSRTGEAERG